MRYLFLPLFTLSLLAGCRSAKAPAHVSGGPSAAFDAASYLPSYPPLPAAQAAAPIAETPVSATITRPAVLQARNAQVEAWLDTVAVRNARVKFAHGYRIQVYAGQDRAAAMAVKETLYRRHPGTEVYLTYTAPSFRILCGDYLNRLEAQLAARSLGRDFPAPLITPAQVRIRPASDL